MNRCVAVFCLLALAGGVLLVGQDKIPTIVFDSQSKDFGKVIEGQPLRHVFKFTNKGQATLEITKVEPGWGCAAALLSAKQIAPGQSGQIEVSVKTEGLQTINKSVTVSSNDPRQPQVVLILTGVVRAEFTLSESWIYFGTVPGGKEVVKEVTVSVQPERPVQILNAETSDPSVLVRFEPVAGSSGKKFRVIATQKADAKDGYHYGIITLKTNSQFTPELKIPVRGLVTSTAQQK